MRKIECERLIAEYLGWLKQGLRVKNVLSKDQATSLAFAVADVRLIRADPLQAFTFLNDVEHPAKEDSLAAIRAYDIQPLLWSQRAQASSFLSGVA